MDSYADSTTGPTVETVLRDELAHGNVMLGTIGPILHHLLDNGGNSFFSDEIVSSVRGMAQDIARQAIGELALAAGAEDPRAHEAAGLAPLASAIVANPAFLAHLHALAIEWQLTQRLQRQLALDPVLPPLLQSLIASADAATAAMAMGALAAQARFCQAQRRMQHPLEELPGDLLQGVLLAMRVLAGTEDEADARAAQAEAAIRARCDASRGRLGLLYRLVTGLGGEVSTALAIGHAGVGLFLSAFAHVSGQDRDLASISTHESQLARLALAMRASGLKQQPIEEQFLVLHPEIALPEGFDGLGPDQAAAILTSGDAAGS